MYDSAGNGGAYREANSRWYWYYHLSNDCMGIGTSTTSSTYSLYLNKGVYAQSRIDATIFYDTNNTGFFVDPSSTSVLNVIRGSTIQHSNSNTAITLDNGTYLMLRDPSGSVHIYLGNSNDPGNYYDNANHYFRNLSATTVGRIDSSGNAIFSGNVTAYGSPSDRRLKENIQPIKDALATVLRLSGCTFDWKEGTDEFKMVGLRADTGFIADEVRDVIPSFVREDENGYLSLRDRGFAALLVEAIKELSAKVDALR
jgi:hypothetical protein